MGTEVSFIKGTFEKVKKEPIQDGQILITTDTGQMFVDVDGETRKQIGNNNNNTELPGKIISMWQPNTEYKVGDVVIAEVHNTLVSPHAFLICSKNHTSQDDPYYDVQEKKWTVNYFYSEYAFMDSDYNVFVDHYATKGELKQSIGDIEAALDELHNYAQALIEGGSE